MVTHWGPLLLGILLCYASTSSAEHRKCFIGCHGSGGSLFKYEEGTNYKYQLEGSTFTKLPGVESHVSKLGLSADVDISVQAQCSYVLKLSNVHISGPDGKKYEELDDLEEHPVRFSFHDGHLESEVCAEIGESHAALNIKRAIISLFQAAIHKETGSSRHHETDVFGTCPTELFYSKSEDALTIKKVRNLNRCAHREDFSSPILSTPYFTKSDFQSSPLLGSSQTVEQTVDEGILKSAASEEVYTYRPMATADSGAQVNVHTQLKFVSQDKGTISANCVEPKSIIFEVAHAADGVSNADAILAAVKKSASECSPNVKSTAAHDFSTLVRLLAQGSKADILSVYGHVKSGAGFDDKETAKNILLDGLARAGSADSVEAIASLLHNHEVTGLKAKLWYLNLGFVKHASRAALKAVTPLLNGEHVPTQAYLGIGVLAGRFCREHECFNVPELEHLEKKLAAPLFAGCKCNSIEEENKLIASLKGLHNIHFLSTEVADKLAECAADTSVKTRIRVAALDTFQSDAAKDTLKKAAINILKNLDEDSEVRIKAYLALVECPCSKVANVVKDVLDNEEINQVGSFIVSHLRNLRASTNPDKAAAKHFLGEIRSSKRFPNDFRKFSQNSELSYSVDALNLGASGESNVIFSQKSYIPRSVSFNLTTQLFGHAFNLFEVDLRSENVDHVLEKYFGPKGYFSQEANEVIDESFDFYKNTRNKLYERYDQSIRPKRSITYAETAEIAEKVDQGIDAHDNDLDIDLSLKLFGSEVGWASFHGDNRLVTPENLIDKFFDSIDASIENAKNIDVDYKRHISFLDADIIYPTGLGFPLKVKAVGSSVVHMKVDGKFDIQSIIRDPKNADVRFQFIPSAAVELSGALTVDAYEVEAGVKVSANLHTATGVDLTFRVLKNGQGVDVKLGLPIKKQDLLTIKNDIVSIAKEKSHDEVSSHLVFNTKKQEYGGCFDQLNPMLGVTFCGSVSFPYDGQKALSALYGPSVLTLRIEKDDESLTSYHFKAYYDKKENHKGIIEILLDTPNSKSNRKLSLIIEGDTHHYSWVKASLSTPWRELIFDGHLTDTPAEHSVSAKLLNDGEEYSAKLGVTVSGDVHHKKYEPLLEYKAPEVKERLIGRKGATKGSKSQQGVGVSGVITLDTKPNSPYRKYVLTGVTVSTPRSQYVIDGSITKDTGFIATDLTVVYDKESLVFKGKLHKKGDTKYSANLAVLPSQYPDFGANINWDYARDKHSIDNNLIVVHGSDPDSDSACFTLTQHIKYKYESSQLFDIATKNSVSYPLVGLSGKLDAASTQSSISYILEGGYDKYHVESKLSAKTGIAKLGDYNIDFGAKALGNSVEFQANREIISDEKSKFTNSLELKPGGKYQLNALVTYNFVEHNIHTHIDAELKLPVEPKILKLTAGVINNKKESGVELAVIAGTKNYIDLKAELKCHGPPSGSFRFLVPSYVDSDGSFSYESGKGQGVVNIDIPKFNRKIEGKADFTVKGSKHAGSIDICWDAVNNPENTIKIETDTDITKSSFDSRNTLHVKESKAQVNVKAGLEGALNDGTLTAEVDLTLFTGRHLLGKFARTAHYRPGDSEGVITLDLTDYASQGANPRKFGYKVAVKNIDPVKFIFDGQGDAYYVTPKNADVKLHAVFKRVPQGEKWLISGQSGLSGSLLPCPFNFKLDSEASSQSLQEFLKKQRKFPPVNYHIVASAGTHYLIDSSGKANEHQLSNEIELKLPSEYPVHHFKWTTSNVLDIFPAEGHFIKVKSSNSIHWNGDKYVKFSGEATQEEKGGSAKAEWESTGQSVRVLTGSAHFDPSRSDDSTKADAALSLDWEGKTAEVQMKAERNKDKDGGSLHISGSLPKQGKFEFNLKNKLSKEGKSLHTEASLITNDKKISITNKLEIDRDHPLLDFVAEHPHGKTRVYFKADKKGERHWVAENKVKWANNGGGSFSADGEVNLDSVDNFFIKFNADSPKLKLEKWHVDIGNRPAKGSGKKITFSAKSADKIVFAGSTTYNIKEDLKNTIIDGSGNLKVGEKSYPLTFKYVYQVFNEADNGEDGGQVKLDVKAGKYVYNLFGKISSDEFVVKRNYCQDTDCSKFEVVSKLKKFDVMQYDHELSILLDLSSLFKDVNDVSIKSTTKRNALIFDHNFEAKWSPSDKIKYKAYVHEHQSGIELHLPKRVLAAEVVYEIPKQSAKQASTKIQATIWLDKTKAPQQKTSVLLTSDYAIVNEGSSVKGEFRVTHPALEKDLCVKGHAEFLEDFSKLVEASIDFDLFAKKNQKITVDWKLTRIKEKSGFVFDNILHIKSKGQNIDIEAERHMSLKSGHFTWSQSLKYTNCKGEKRHSVSKLETSPDTFDFLIKVHDTTVLSFEVKQKTPAKNHLHITSLDNVVGRKYFETVDIRDNNHIKYSIIMDKGGQEHLFEFTFGFAMGQVAEVSASVDKKIIGNVEIALDEANFLKTKYNYDIDNAKLFSKLAVDDTIWVGKESNKVATEIIKTTTSDITSRIEEVRKALPNLKPVINAYTEQLKALREEVVTEQVKEAADYIRGIFSVVIEQVVIILEEAANFTESLLNVFNEFATNLSKMLNHVLPKISESYLKISSAIIDVIEEGLKFSVDSFHHFLDFVKEHEEEIQQFATICTDFVADIGSVFGKVFTQFHTEIEEFIIVFIEQVKALPIFAIIEEKWEELKVYQIPEQSWQVYHEIIEGLKQSLPTPEISQFISTLTSYIEKILKHQQIDPAAALRQLYQELIQAFKSVIVLISAQAPEAAVAKPGSLLPIPAISLLKFPSGALRFSPFSWIQSSDLPSISDLYYTYKPTLNPLDWIPPFKATGLLVDSTELFTFDRRHISFKGSCSYILAMDYVDRNFSVVANLEAGKLKSLVFLNDHHKIELKSDQTLVVNDKPSEFPFKHDDIAVWRRYYTTNVNTAGLRVLCSEHLSVCSFHVSGFYFHKTAGLLGTLNNEPYDDLVVPPGKIASSSVDFGNGWKVDDDCPDAPEVKHTHSHVSLCTNLFSGSSVLKSCFPYINPSGYRDACDHVASEASGAENKEKAACHVAVAYSIACRAAHSNVDLPNDCVHCKADGKTLEIGETLNIKTPQKSADIVLVVEQVAENEEVFKDLVTPLVSTLTNDLHDKGISEVHFHLIGYGGLNMKWPAHYTTHGKLDFTGKCEHIHFESPVHTFSKYSLHNKTTTEKVKDLWQILKLQFGGSNRDLAFREARNFPFRPESVKAVIGVMNTQCEDKGIPLGIQQTYLRLFWEAINYKVSGIEFHLITSLEHLSFKDKDTKSVVGFDSNYVYSLGDSKKKPLHGDEAVSLLEYPHDYCTEFTEAVGGAVFSAHNFVASKPSSRKQFLQIVSQRISEGLTHTAHELYCICTLSHGFIPVTKCLVSDSTEREMHSKHTKHVKG